MHNLMRQQRGGLGRFQPPVHRGGLLAPVRLCDKRKHIPIVVVRPVFPRRGHPLEERGPSFSGLIEFRLYRIKRIRMVFGDTLLIFAGWADGRSRRDASPGEVIAARARSRRARPRRTGRRPAAPSRERLSELFAEKYRSEEHSLAGSDGVNYIRYQSQREAANTCDPEGLAMRYGCSPAGFRASAVFLSILSGAGSTCFAQPAGCPVAEDRNRYNAGGIVLDYPSNFAPERGALSDDAVTRVRRPRRRRTEARPCAFSGRECQQQRAS